MNTFINRTFDEERALYGMQDMVMKACRFDGPADGESACKECRGVAISTFVTPSGMMWI